MLNIFKVKDGVPRPYLFFAIVLIFSVPFYGLNYLDIPTPLNLPPSFMMIVVPVMAALFLSYQEKGWRGTRDLFTKLWPGAGRNVRWIAITLLTVPTLMGAMYAILWLTGQSATTQQGSTGLLAALAFAQYFLGAIPEEIGWTAYTTGPLQSRLGVVKAGLLIGSVWELWHLIPFLQIGRSWWWIAAHVFASVGVRVIMGYVYVGTRGALLAAIIVHSLFNFVPEVLPGGYSDYQPVVFLPVVFVGAYLISKISASDKITQVASG
jgi:membrane protease YdiL (CAAX protease family)